MTTINVPLLEATLGRILAEPENWQQGEWATSDPVYLPAGNTCGTAMCFAGHAAVLDGAHIVANNNVVSSDGRWASISRYAKDALGLTDEQGNDLFYGLNSLDDLQCKVKDLVEQAQQ